MKTRDKPLTRPALVKPKPAKMRPSDGPLYAIVADLHEHLAKGWVRIFGIWANVPRPQKKDG